MQPIIQSLKQHRSARFGLALLSGILNGVGFIWLGGVSFFANVPLLLALYSSTSLAERLALGGLVGFFAGLHIYGIAHYGWFLLIFFAFYTASQMVLYGGIYHYLWHRLSRWGHLLLPVCIWSLTEWIRTLGPFSMPASYVGNIALDDYLAPWLYLAPWFGGLFVSACVALVQSLSFLFLLDRKGYRRQLSIGALLFIGLGVFGTVMTPSMDGDPLEIVGVQAGLHNSRYDAARVDPLAREELLNTFESLTQAAYKEKPELVIWPETAIRETILDQPLLKRRFDPPHSSETTLVAGVHTREGNELFNSAVSLSGQKVIDEVHKIKLVMGTEDHFTRGSSHRPLETAGPHIGVMICLEAVYPLIGRELVLKGSELLVVMSNDAGFGYSPITHHMTRRAAIRALETDRWLVRVGQAGLSVIISPRGDLIAELPLFKPALLRGVVKRRTTETLYVKSPWLYPVFNLVLLAALPFIFRRRSNQRNNSPAA